jgi:lysophospholipase L1-like esterase
MKNTFFLLLYICFALQARAQKKVVVIGSSTALGWFASSGNSFVERLQANYPTHTFTNLALQGTNTYQAREESSTIPGKPAADPLRNIKAALDLNPDIILVSYPTNDVVSGFTNEETINNLKNIDSSVLARGKQVFFIGTQPRDIAEALRIQLETQNELIITAFPTKSINVYPELVRSGGFIALDVRYLDINGNPDGIHLNDEGHRRIFEKVKLSLNSVLPVILTRFSVDRQGSGALLTWETASEQNSDRFDIERSSNSSRFSSIGTVRAMGQSNRPMNYSFRDDSPAQGINDYRLNMIDIDGKKAYSKSVRIKVSSASSTKAYPIPASSLLHVSTTQPPNTEVKIMVMDMQGKLLQTQTHRSHGGHNTYQLQVGSLRSGTYQLLISSSKGTERLSFMKH